MAFTKKQLERMLADNPEVSIQNDNTSSESPTDAQKQLKRAVRESLSRLFLAHWKRNELPDLESEYKFHPERRWKFDFAIPDKKIAIEVEGGTRQYGRHNRAEGYAKDAEKYNAAQAMGWQVFRLSDVMLKEGQDAVDAYLQPVREAIGWQPYG